jgi:hypothetical protein
MKPKQKKKDKGIKINFIQDVFGGFVDKTGVK